MRRIKIKVARTKYEKAGAKQENDAWHSTGLIVFGNWKDRWSFRDVIFTIDHEYLHEIIERVENIDTTNKVDNIANEIWLANLQ